MAGGGHAGLGGLTRAGLRGGAHGVPGDRVVRGLRGQLRHGGRLLGARRNGVNLSLAGGLTGAEGNSGDHGRPRRR